MNFKEHPYEVGLNGVVGKINNERISLVWAYGKQLKIMRWRPATNGKNNIIDNTSEMKKNFFHQEDLRKLGSLISTIIATFLRESFRWNMTQDKSNEEIGGFKISHSWQHVNHETRTQIVKNDITPPQKIREKELHFGMQDEECLNFSKQTCVEHHVYFRV